MGWGDEIIATGEARHLQQQYGLGAPQVAVCGRDGKPRWHPAWDGNPRLVRPERVTAGHLRMTHGSHCRPYVDYEAMRRDFETVFPRRPFTTKIKDARLPWRFTRAKVRRGDLYCVERLRPGGYVVIEPHFKAIQINRDWGWKRWQAVVDSLDLDWVQINPSGARLLAGARHVPGDTFLSACRTLSAAALYLGPEGGLYHAAAALGVPAVAIFGGYVSPENQGYDDCVNLYDPMNGQSPCGQRTACAHCRAAMANIRPEIVAHHVRAMLKL